MPASQPLAPSIFLLLSPELIFALSFLLVGLASAILASQVRAAFPEPARPGLRRLLHYAYPSLFGVFLALLLPSVMLLGVHWSVRSLLGVVAPRAWRPLYAAFRVRLRQRLGLELPGAPKARVRTKKRGSQNERKRPTA